MSVSQQEWKKVADENRSPSLTTEELDNLVTDWRTKREAYDAAKKISNERYAEFQAAEFKLKEALTQVGKSNYDVDGLGKVYKIIKQVVKLPSDLGDRKKFLQYLRKKGEEFYLATVTVNYNTLQSFYTQEFENAKDEGKALGFKIPGISEPTTNETLGFRKSSKKGNTK